MNTHTDICDDGNLCDLRWGVHSVHKWILSFAYPVGLVCGPINVDYYGTTKTANVYAMLFSMLVLFHAVLR